MIFYDASGAGRQENHASGEGRQCDGAEIESSVGLSMGCKSVDFL